MFKMQQMPHRRIVGYVFAMCWGSVSFGYASAIIATTLGTREN